MTWPGNGPGRCCLPRHMKPRNEGSKGCKVWWMKWWDSAARPYVLDELGRGTSTFDGFAVAHATLAHLALGVGCRLMFAT